MTYPSDGPNDTVCQNHSQNASKIHHRVAYEDEHEMRCGTSPESELDTSGNSQYEQGTFENNHWEPVCIGELLGVDQEASR